MKASGIQDGTHNDIVSKKTNSANQTIAVVLGEVCRDLRYLEHLELL